MKTKIIILDGAKGAGKSTVSGLLKESLTDWEVIRFDDIRQLLKEGPELEDVNNFAFEALIDRLRSNMSEGINTIVDCGLTQQRSMSLQEDLMQQNVEMYLYHLSATRDVLWKRIQGRPQCATPDRERFDYLYDALTTKDLSQFHVIDTKEEDAEAIRDRILMDIRKAFLTL